MRLKWVCGVSALAISLAGLLAIAQDGDQTNVSSDVPQSTKISQENVAIFRVEDTATHADVERIENPVFRYSENARGPAQGAVWLWGRKGRPVAVLEMIRHRHEDWFCFHATSDHPIKLTAQTGQIWTPKTSELRFQPLAGAPRPADLPSHRMRQMKELAQRFTAYQLYEDGRHEMRVLPTAVHRYEDPEKRLIDGAIFLIAIGTHPEATLFLEASPPTEKDQSIWNFAVGRSGAAEMFFKYDDKEVHHLPLIETFPPATNSYWRMLLRKTDDK